MNDNYLWDRSGEADPEVQQLEEILGALGYQPRPLRIPNDLQIGRRRTYFQVLAIAAAIALLAVGLGLWFSFARQRTGQNQASGASPTQQAPGPDVVPNPPNRDTVAAGPTPTPNVERRREPNRFVQVGYRPRSSRSVISQPELTPQELAEKEQVLVALRLVSSKLSFARRKAQGEPPLNTIRNQHRIG